jgi:hypothetical protein
LTLSIQTVEAATHAVPKELWTALGYLAAALLGGGMTFLAVVLQNRNENKRHEASIAHEAKEKQIEREGALRKEIYLEAVATIAKQVEVLWMLMDPNMKEQELKAKQERFGQDIGRVNIVGSLQTIEALLATQRFFGETLFLAHLKRRTWINTYNRLRRIPLSMGKFLSDLADAAAGGKELLDAALARAEKESKELQEDAISLLETVTEFMDFVSQRAEELQRLASIATAHLRKELGISIDEEAFSRVIEEHNRLARKALRQQMEAVLEEIRRLREVTARKLEKGGQSLSSPPD